MFVIVLLRVSRMKLILSGDLQIPVLKLTMVEANSKMKSR